MTKTQLEALWLRIHAVFSSFAGRVAAQDSTLEYDIGQTTNDAFIVRGYLAFRKSAGGDEIAITVDIRSDGTCLIVESDICTDSGEVIAAGPSACVERSQAPLQDESALNSWLGEFEQFLLGSEKAIVRTLSTLE